MRLKWYLFRSKIALFFSRNKKFGTIAGWAALVGIVAVIFAVPITMSIRNPDIQLPQFHGTPQALIDFRQEWSLAAMQLRRERGRLNDFVMMVNHIQENYPFTELTEQRYGVDYLELAIIVFNELAYVARYETTPGFFNNFLREEFLSHLGSFGGLALAGHPTGMPPWITQPYFFGYYDWQFTEDRLDLPIRENIIAQMLSTSAMHLRINSFVPRGYMPGNRNPFWYFCFDNDKEYLTNLNFDGIEDLVIDIRGLSNGFRGYFLPLILEPNLQSPVSTRFYAFHANEDFANNVSSRYRDWYGATKPTSATGFGFNLPEVVTLGFPVDVAATPTAGMDFDGRIWLLTDSANFTGPNFAYLQKARDAGFTIVYEESENITNWDTSFFRLPHSGISVRFNPLYFTDAAGRGFEAAGAFYDYRLEDVTKLAILSS